MIEHDHDSMRVRVDRGEGCQERFFYRTGGLGVLDAEGLHFEGTLLFHRTAPGNRPAVWGSRLRTLSLDGLLQIDAPAIIHSLELADDRCDVVVDEDQVSRVRFSARDGVTLVINGRPQPTRALRARPSMVTA